MPTLVGNSTKREGSTRLRSQKGVPVLDETYHYLVQADYVDQAMIEILQTSGLPLVNQTTSAGGIAVCRSKSATRRPNQTLYWDVTCEFSSQVEEGGGENDPQSDPNSWVPVYETKFERMQEVVTKDFDGDAIANSAGQAFEQGLTITRHIPIWDLFQFSPLLSPEDVIARTEIVNKSKFKGRDPKTLLCTVVSSVQGFYYGQKRSLTHYQLRYNEKNWRHKRLDVGTQYKSNCDIKTSLDADGEIYLASLDGSGGLQACGDPPAILEFDMYEAKDFTFLRT